MPPLKQNPAENDRPKPAAGETEKRKWSFDETDAPWKTGGPFRIFVDEMVSATVDALNEFGTVQKIKIGQKGNISEGEGIVTANILNLDSTVEWFVENGYFTYDKDEKTFHPTSKWLDRFK